MPAAAPLIMGGASLASSYIGGKMGDSAAKKAAMRSPEEQALFKSQTGLADQQKAQGGQMFGRAMPAINQSLNYYGTLLGGNRAARTNAIAPEANDIASAYGGAGKALAGRYITGGEKSTALAENERAKAGQISRLVTGVRPGAAGAMGSTGMALAGGAGQMYGGASRGYEGLIHNSTNNRLDANFLGQQKGAAFSKQMGGLIADLMKAYGGRKTSSGGGSASEQDD